MPGLSKTTTAMLLRLAIAALVALSSPLTGAAAELPPGATVLDPDLLWDVANPDAFALSPDGKQIAYISKGALMACSVTHGPPAKLAELPNTVTAILAQPGNEKQREQSATMPYTPGYWPFSGPVHLDRQYIFSVAWAPNQDGLVYTARKRVRENSSVAAYHVMLASLAGVVTEIATIEGDFGVPAEHTFSFYVTPDRNFVIVSSYNATLIWDVKARRPRVSCYEYLVPSTRSGRYLGVEIDTRQLVLVDRNFQVVQRFDVTFASERRLELTWSPDERQAICRIYREHGSREWDGFQVQLNTGVPGPDVTGVAADRFLFTGHDGEVVRLGIAPPRQGAYADGSDGAYITVTADAAPQERYIARFSGTSRGPGEWRDRRSYPPALSNRDGTLFAMAMPRPNDQRAGFHFHLIDRAGKLTPFVPRADNAYNTPYLPIAFADDDRRLIGRLGATLFSLPVSELTEPTESDDD